MRDCGRDEAVGRGPGLESRLAAVADIQRPPGSHAGMRRTRPVLECRVSVGDVQINAFHDTRERVRSCAVGRA